MRLQLIIVVFLAGFLPFGINGAELTDSEIRDSLIKQSIASYLGNCPCPYNVDRTGRRCGARSAYSKQGVTGRLVLRLT